MKNEVNYSHLALRSKEHLLEEKDTQLYKYRTVLKDLLAIISELEEDYQGVLARDGELVKFKDIRSLEINRKLARYFIQKDCVTR